MADEVFGSNGEYLRTFIKGFSRFQLDRLKSILVTSKTRHHEELLTNILDGSSDERTSLYSIKEIGLFLRGMTARTKTKVTRAIFDGCRVTFRRGTYNVVYVEFYDDSIIPSIPQNQLDMMNATFTSNGLSSVSVALETSTTINSVLEASSELQVKLVFYCSLNIFYFFCRFDSFSCLI
jgi:hypothetical protein